MSLPILLHDDHYVAVHKPPNLLVHRSPISRDRVFLLQQLRDQIGQRVYPIHRLDRATSGVLIFGLHPEAVRRLAHQFEHKQIHKVYQALARGWVDDCGTIDHPMTDEDGNGRLQMALTHYRCLHRVELPISVDRYPNSRYCLAEVIPETGRRQQIRKHFRHISHHLIGDTTHGSGKHNRFFREHFGIHRLMLQASVLSFVHPFTETRCTLVARPEEDWMRLARAFGWPPLNPEQDSRERTPSD